ncbi:MAG: hypothetical protein O3B31_11765 [Chloroflexi bacterium]|nr:hypothetical protein [Chloroflexota bacterium]
MAATTSALAEITVRSPAGKPFRLAGLWADRPTVLVLLRHFG